MEKNPNQVVIPPSHLFYLLGAILTTKMGLFLLDHQPMFLMGDSLTYLLTALAGWIPDDRSFVYGFLVRLLAVTTGSLTPLIFCQTILGGGSALAVFLILVRYFGVTPRIAMAMALLCAFDPLQLLYERFVLTETVALFLFAAYSLLFFEYLRGHQLLYLVGLQLLGMLVVSIRVSFLPLIVANGLILPLMTAPAFTLGTARETEQSNNSPPGLGGKRFFTTQTIIHLLLSLLFMGFIHQSYKILYAYLANHDHSGYQQKGRLFLPGYQYASGFFLLGDWAPVVKPDDFPDNTKAGTIFTTLDMPLTRRNRPHHRWQSGGLIANINKEFPLRHEAEKLAGRTAINALRRDPGGILRLGWSSFLDYWDVDFLKSCMQIDRGGDMPLHAQMLTLLRDKFNLNAKDHPFLNTISKGYYDFAWPFPLLLLALPGLSLFALPFFPLPRLKYSLPLFLAAAETVGVASLLVERPTVRYLHPLGWLLFIVLGLVMHRLPPIKARLKQEYRLRTTNNQQAKIPIPA